MFYCLLYQNDIKFSNSYSFYGPVQPTYFERVAKMFKPRTIGINIRN